MFVYIDIMSTISYNMSAVLRSAVCYSRRCGVESLAGKFQLLVGAGGDGICDCIGEPEVERAEVVGEVWFGVMTECVMEELGMEEEGMVEWWM